MKSFSTYLLLASTTLTLGALGFVGFVPTAEAGCTVNVGAQACYGWCYVNTALGYCDSGGACAVNAWGYCDGLCTTNVAGSCGFWGGCQVNVLGTCDGSCLVNVLATCGEFGTCDVNVASGCFTLLP